MSYKYTGLISQNIAPKGAKRIAVYDSNNAKIGSFQLGMLKQPNAEKSYSFGLVSDIHLWSTEPGWKANTKYDKALSYFENKGCAFCIVCGDLTQTGLYRRTDESDSTTTYLDESQFAKYKEICDKHTIPIYEIMGNHESYYGMPISNNIDKMKTYTGNNELSYTVEQGNDLFILLGQPRGGAVMSDEDFEWFESLLANNQDKRCFVFVHSYIEEDSGDANDLRENSIFDYWGAAKTNAFINLLNQYNNVVLFHGHSHIKFEYQAVDRNANYTEKNGFKSIHIPSLSRPRDLADSSTPYADSESYGYIVDVYDDFIVLNGIDFINNRYCPLGTYKIDMPLGTITT